MRASAKVSAAALPAVPKVFCSTVLPDVGVIAVSVITSPMIDFKCA